MVPALALERLTKRYGRLEAVRTLSLEVASGEIYGFLGVNGAGKTTTIRLVLDLLRPTSGAARVFGHDCHRHGREARALVAYLPGELGLFHDMTGSQVLNLLGRLGPRPVDPAWRAELLDRFRLSGRDLDRPIREYSTGMKRKLGLVQAFQHEAPLLVLDEPTEGLDPLMQDEFFNLLTEETGQGRTVFMSSHVLSEVERACHRVGLLREGHLAIEATVRELRAMAARQVRVLFGSDTAAPDRWPTGCRVVSVSPRAWHLEVQGTLEGLVQTLPGRPVVDLQVDTPRLEDVLARYYRGSA